VKKDLALKAPSKEILKRCFKFIRVVKKALMNFDPILAVTYDYKERSGEHRNQEVWFGKLKGAGMSFCSMYNMHTEGYIN
jgi:hypothetical protein